MLSVYDIQNKMAKAQFENMVDISGRMSEVFSMENSFIEIRSVNNYLSGINITLFTLDELLAILHILKPYRPHIDIWNKLVRRAIESIRFHNSSYDLEKYGIKEWYGIEGLI